jgi:hypothetical protein
MLDQSSTSEAAGALAKWPIVEAFFMIVITFLGVAAWFRGEKDSKALPGQPPAGMDMTTYLMQHDAAKSIRDIEEQVTKQTAILMDLARLAEAANRGQEHTHKLLTEIMNNQELGMPLSHRPTRKRDFDSG